ncbi:MAG TPA: hypothetical protein VMB50_10955, partial [Myxococcales bacterium]|nr:hypothetical protein [Myxococcales bacterium]
MVSKWIAGVAVAFSSAAAAQQVINPPPQLISPGQNTCFDPANSAVSFNWNGHPGQVLTAFNPSAGYDVDYNFSNGPLPSAWN